MRLFLEIILILILLAVGVYGSVSDLKSGLIKNRILIWTLVLVVAVDIVYYAFFMLDTIGDFAVNSGIVIAIAVILYLLKIWAGGDVKMCIVMSLAYPSGWYIVLNDNIYTMYLAVGMAFVAGYVFLLITGIHRLITGQNKITKKSVALNLKNWVLSYVKTLAYVIFMELIYVIFIADFIDINKWILTFAFIIAAWVVNKVAVLKKWPIVAVVAVLDVAGCIYANWIPFSTNVFNYALILLLVIIQSVLSDSNYDRIRASDIRKGMILSTASSVLLVNSRIKCNIRISRENLDDRLKEDEAAAIAAWGNNKDYELAVVRKIPFAIFIATGFLIYLIIRVIQYCL